MIIIVYSLRVIDIHFDIKVECNIGKHIIVEEIVLTFPDVLHNRRDPYFSNRRGVRDNNFSRCCSVSRTLRDNTDPVSFFRQIV